MPDSDNPKIIEIEQEQQSETSNQTKINNIADENVILESDPEFPVIH